MDKETPTKLIRNSFFLFCTQETIYAFPIDILMLLVSILTISILYYSLIYTIYGTFLIN